MSKALRCDRCGNTFSPILIGVTDLFTTIPEITMQNRDNYIQRVSYQRKIDLNLCPKCTNDFLEFMEDFKNETETISAAMSFAECSEHYIDPQRYTGGKINRGYGSGRSCGDSDGDFTEREDDTE